MGCECLGGGSGVGGRGSVKVLFGGIFWELGWIEGTGGLFIWLAFLVGGLSEELVWRG